MRSASSLLVASLILPLLGGCMFQSVTATEKLRDSVLGLNDEIRWNRMDLARDRVVAPYQAEFAIRLRHWHRDLQIADSEIVGVEVGEDRSEATSVVSFRWYSNRTMTISETTLRQYWRRGVDGYFLWEMEVTDGDPSLLAALPQMEEDPADGPVASN